MKRIALLSLFLLLPFRAESAPSMQDLSVKVAEDFILPAYERLAVQSRNQAEHWAKTCDIDDLKPAFQQTSDAWAAVQHMNYGPITFLLRRDRLYHWPERRNAVSKSLNKILATKQIPDDFTTTSVALQGLPALERLLYTDMESDKFSCQLGQAIARNIQDITEGAYQDWQELVTYFKEGKAHPIYFDTMDEVGNRLFTELLAGFQMISDQKIALPMGSSLEKANGKRAEGWRSKRSTRYIQQSALGLMAMSRPFMEFLPGEAKKQVQIQFSLFARRANTLPISIKNGVKDEAGRLQIRKFLDESRKTRNQLVDTFTKYLGLTVGFNSLDGD
ncbi:imelysin family protein [Terasakiella sp. A23]|uniref:imelysin family protein n=1 Tax=Terasakiella sp. FCG-A23 TaxID=3080561 RepID=UPI00295472CA|nr:imelysin family protein [Terasakiella sp. A23]MDV7340239.1 imelysin family protein [Terasakiella sp. A23]